ncbi:MAG: plasmid pRiA4b ORF-3 family protein [Deltaproteobacteria bacterium]|nr:plasmid pRiA4b ORF-3 family protein [Deltaproteobacteria bacterium]
MAGRVTATKPKNEACVYRLKVTLKRSKPPIWRRLEVRSDTTLEMLHNILQIAMGWSNDHLHQFVIDDTYYSSPPPGYDDADFYVDAEPGQNFTLAQVAPVEKTKFIYEYDFGDGWEHQILVEKIQPLEPGKDYPVCVTGKRACPPEDIGGIWGYDFFLQAIKDPKHPRRKRYIERFGDLTDYDPEAFDLDAVNDELKKIK